MGTTRDYYADLEISPTAEVTEIKKQYRKLGMPFSKLENTV
jgi:curved DNA-binding protein CbpA